MKRRNRRGLLTSAVAIHAGACLIAFFTMGSLGAKVGSEAQADALGSDTLSDNTVSLETYLEEQRFNSVHPSFRVKTEPTMTVVPASHTIQNRGNSIRR